MRRFHFFPRLILFSLAILFGWLAINPIVRNTIANGVESISGTTTTIAKARTVWRQNKVSLTDVTLADPYNPDRNLLQADRIDLELDRSAFVRRRAVVKRGSVRGLRLGTERSNSVAIPPEKIAAYQAGVNEQFKRTSGDWLAKSVARVQAGWSSEIKTAQVAEELAARWPAQNKTIERDATALLARAIAIRTELEQSGQNRLRNITAYQKAAAEIEQLARSITEVERHASQQQQQMRMDHEALATASQQDSASLEQQAGLASLDEDSLSEYLVAGEVSRRLADVLQWVVWSRRLTPTFSNSQRSADHGRDVFFGNQSASPHVTIESLVLQGAADLGKGDVPLDGTVRNWSSDATLSQTPTEIVIQTGGETPMLVQTILDRTTENAQDRIVVDCPRIPCEGRLLGTTDDLSLAISPGDMHMWCHIELDGDRMSGKMLMRQTHAKFTPQSGSDLANPAINAALNSAVAGLDNLNISVKLAGTITTPQWSLTSNVGPHLATALHQSLQQQLTSESQQQVRGTQKKALEQLLTIETQVVKRQDATMKSLRESLEAIHAVRDQIATRVKLTDAIIDPKSPLREVYVR